MLHDTLAFIVNDVDAKIKARGGNVEASTMASRFLTVYVVWLAASSHDAMPGGWLRQVERWRAGGSCLALCSVALSHVGARLLTAGHAGFFFDVSVGRFTDMSPHGELTEKQFVEALLVFTNSRNDNSRKSDFINAFYMLDRSCDGKLSYNEIHVAIEEFEVCVRRSHR
jgi:hypothetical protein